MNQQVKNILAKIKEKYSNIDTILLFGSATTENWTDQSDIDIFLIDDELKTGRLDEKIDDIDIEIQTDNFETLEKDIESERFNLKNRNLSNMIKNSITAKSRSLDKLENLKTLATSVIDSKTKFSPEEEKMWRYSIEDYLGKAEKDLARGDSLAFYLDTNFVIENALELGLAKKGSYFPQPKNLSALLAELQPSLLTLLKEFLKESDPKQKLLILNEIRDLEF